MINRKFQMIQQRPNTDDDKDAKSKLLEGTYLKMSTFPAEINIVSTNNMSASNTSTVISKHNYSLPPQTDYTQQPITLISQTSQQQNKARSNSLNSGQTNFAIATNIQDMQNKITLPTSNIKLNIVPSLAQVMQSGGLVIDAKSLNNAANESTATALAEGGFVTAGTSTAQQHFTPQYIQHTQGLEQQQQPKIKQEKTVNMMYDVERNRILYTNLKGNRSGTQFLAQINPKMVNILPIQHKNVPGTVQAIATQAMASGKTIEHIASPITSRLNQQLTRKKLQDDEFLSRVQVSNINANTMTFGTIGNAVNDSKADTENTKTNIFVTSMPTGSELKTMRKESLSKILAVSSASKVSIANTLSNIVAVSSTPNIHTANLTNTSIISNKGNTVLPMLITSNTLTSVTESMSMNLPIATVAQMPTELLSLNSSSSATPVKTSIQQIVSTSSAPTTFFVTRDASSISSATSTGTTMVPITTVISSLVSLSTTSSPSTTRTASNTFLSSSSPPLLSLTLSAARNNNAGTTSFITTSDPSILANASATHTITATNENLQMTDEVTNR